jgi:hypothetical protein
MNDNRIYAGIKTKLPPGSFFVIKEILFSQMTGFGWFQSCNCRKRKLHITPDI